MTSSQVRDLIGYAGSPPHPQWPGDANIAVNIVINYEEGSEYSFEMGDSENDTLGELVYPFPAKIRDLAQESTYEYGSRAGIWRLLRLLEEHNIPATFFGCAVAFERNPAVARAASAAGHDLLAHGYRWEEPWRLDRQTESDRMKLAVESLTHTWGSPPEGWYCRYSPSVNTRSLVVENGSFLYDSDAYNDDLPYFVAVDGAQHLVVPYTLFVNDTQGIKHPEDFFNLLLRTYDELWREGEQGQPKMMSIGLHPRLAGQPARVSALRSFLEHAKGRGSTWFARRSDIARHWIETFGSTSEESRLSSFE